MRILFDGYWWGSGPSLARTTQRELVHAWRQVFPTDRVAVALRSDAPTHDLPAGVEPLTTHLWPHGLSNSLELDRLAARWQADIVVAQDHTPPRRAAVTFINDATYLDHPQWFPTRQRSSLATILPSARFARVVATGTDSEARRIEKHALHLAPVTALGVAPRTPLMRAVPERPPIADGIDAFALAVGRVRSAANVEAAIAAAVPSTRITARTPLIVLTDATSRAAMGRLPKTVKRLRDEGLVRLTGRVSDSARSWLYHHASVALALHHDDPRGSAALEATWFDTPLVASDIPVHHETAGGWARFVAPTASAAEVAAQLDATWNAPGDEDARARILEHATWHAVARSLHQAIVPVL